jgi:hypothetical protein
MFVNQPSELIASHDPAAGYVLLDERRRWLRRSEAQPSMGTMLIVMTNEDGDRSFEMPAIQDEQPVETFISNGSHEALRDGVGAHMPSPTTPSSTRPSAVCCPRNRYVRFAWGVNVIGPTRISRSSCRLSMAICKA